MWIEDYGQDLPVYRKLKLSTFFQYHRAKQIHFRFYKTFYFVEEQQVDPLATETLGSKAFDIYQFKRLIRAVKYDEQRDTSFDFLQIGEDDIDEYDDFV